MLHLILGPAGSGKTRTVRGMLADFVRSGREGLILLVPEQNTFESERALLRLLGASASGRVEVLSFTRLIDRVQREHGGFAGKLADDGVRMIVMRRALRACTESLDIYAKSSRSPEFAKSMLDLVTELRQCALTPEDLRQTADRLPEGLLRAKTRDIATVFSAYDALLHQSYADPLDQLTRLYGTLGGYHFFKGKTVFLDAYKGFTEQQYLILSRIFLQADDVYAALCADGLSDPARGLGLFSNVKAAAARLVRLARECGAPVAEPLVLAEPRRFTSPALAGMEAALRGEKPEPCPAAGQLTICAAQSVYDEADFAARTIRRLTRQEGLRYRDFVVIARDADAYAGVIDSALERYGIPYFMDARTPAAALPLMRFVLDALGAAQGGYAAEYLMSYLKSPLSPVSTEEAAELENYAFVWKLRGADWLREWTQNPDGFAEQTDTARLAALNALRRRAMEPLAALEEYLKSGSARAACTGIWNLLDRTDAAGRLRDYALTLEQAGEPALAHVQVQSWDALVSVLDQMVAALGDEHCPAQVFCELLETVLAAQDIGTAPSRTDEVIVGSADRVRPSEPRVVFVLGANYREFPKPPGAGGLLTERDRARLIAGGLKMPDRSQTESVEERFLVYTSLCCAAQRAYILYHRAGPDGSPAVPADFVAQLSDALHITPEEEADSRADRLESPSAAMELAAVGADAARYHAALSAYFAQRGDTRRLHILDAQAAAGRGEAFALSPNTARRLFGEQVRLSPSKVEVYHKCGFSFFCKYGMGAKLLRPADLDVMQKGTLVHDVLEKMLARYGKRLSSLSDDARRSEIDALLRKYCARMLGGEAEKTPRFLYLYNRTAELLDALLRHIGEELAQSEFSPVDCELSIAPDGEVPPIALPLPDGGSVSVSGIADRVDIFEKDGVHYVRVVDYKTGTRDFSLADVLHGLNMQMLIYLFTICENGGARYGKTAPAGILYMPAKKPVASAGRDASPQEIASAHNKQLRMNGLLVAEEDVLRAMEPDGGGVYVPYSVTKSGLSARSSVASQEDFGRIEQKIRALLTGMGERLHAGDIAVRPLDGTDSPACKYCDYRAVCLRDRARENRAVEKTDLKTALRALQREEGDLHGLSADGGTAKRD